MKKYLIAAVLSAMLLTGCSDVKDFLLTDITQENTELSQSEDEVSFIQDDFAFYTAGDDNTGTLLVGLGMKKSDIDFEDADLNSYLKYLDIQYRDETDVMHEYIDGDGNKIDMNRVSYISYLGGRRPIMTMKGIRTTGLGNPDTSQCSDVQDVIDRYGIDTENEDYMTPSPSDPNQYTIQLYFRDYFNEEEKQAEIREQEAKQQEEKEDYDEEDAVISSVPKKYERIIFEEGETPGDKETDYSIRFVISNDKVIDIQMYRY